MTKMLKRGEVWLADLNPTQGSEQSGKGNGGLIRDYVALCFQMWVLDKTRLLRRLGQLSPEIITQLEEVVLLTLGYES